MHRFARALVAAALFVCAWPVQADNMKTIIYPETRRDKIVEVQFGERIADPYRWLEGDVRSDAQVADWVARQNAVSRAYLDALHSENGLQTICAICSTLSVSAFR